MLLPVVSNNVVQVGLGASNNVAGGVTRHGPAQKSCVSRTASSGLSKPVSSHIIVVREGSLRKSEVDVAVGRGGEEEQPVETGLLNGLGVKVAPFGPCLLVVPVLVDLLGEEWRLAVLAGLADLVHEVRSGNDGNGRPEEVLQRQKQLH